jgi:glycosyltransferase involved in cell wall biosynthesis
MKFIITIAAYNCADLVGRTIDSLLQQTFSNWQCVFVDDVSTDDTAGAARLAARGDARISIIRNGEKKYLLRNMAEAIDAARPDPGDVVVPVDGDDYLAHPEALARLARAYEEGGAWMTFGSYEGTDQRRGKDAAEYPALVRRFRWYRRSLWRASHLKSFKVWLWRNIKPSDLTITPEQVRSLCRSRLFRGNLRSWWQLRKVPYHDLVDPSGRYLRRCVDKAIMWPMLEMAGPRAVFIPDILYIYQRREQRASNVPHHANRFLRLHLKRLPRYPARPGCPDQNGFST